jgi:hypothetical protein
MPQVAYSFVGFAGLAKVIIDIYLVLVFSVNGFLGKSHVHVIVKIYVVLLRLFCFSLTMPFLIGCFGEFENLEVQRIQEFRNSGFFTLT